MIAFRKRPTLTPISGYASHVSNQGGCTKVTLRLFRLTQASFSDCRVLITQTNTRLRLCASAYLNTFEMTRQHVNENYTSSAAL